MNSIFTVQSAALPANTHVTAFVGQEALSKPYEFDIALKITGIDLDVSAAAGARATLTIDRGPAAPPFLFHGILASVELVNDFDIYGLYRAKLVPTLWQLTLTHHSRIFTDESIPSIIESVLLYSGVSAKQFRFALAQSYLPLEHVCQYRESNFNFISRLMEREGMYYYFEQTEDTEVMVITDTKATHSNLTPKPVRYFPSPPGDMSAGESLRTFKCKSQILPASVLMKDYNYLNPSLDVSASAQASTGPGEIVMYGDNFQTPKEASRYAQIRAEEIRTRQTIFTGSGYQFYMRPGYLFQLDEHSRPSFNANYLAIDVMHIGNQSLTQDELENLFGVESADVYNVTVQAIAKDVQFRAARTAPWPRIFGVVDGVVDGPSMSPYAQIDMHGRYKVRIFFDESDLIDGSASTWVRMLQPHGGSIEGQHFPLRKGTEVHLVFLGGDPDRPVIAGVAPNSQKPSVVTQSNYTKNVIRTGSNNFIEMEDLIGSTYIKIYCPYLNSMLHLGAGAKNFVLTTDGEGLIHTGASLEVDVDVNKSEDVDGSVTETYQGPFSTDVVDAVKQTYHSTYNLDVTGKVTINYQNALQFDVALAANENYHNVRNLTVAAAATEKFQSGLDTTVSAALAKQTYEARHEQYVTGGGQLVDVTGAHDLKVSDAQNVTIGSDKTDTIGGNYTIDVGGNLTHTVAGSSTIQVAGTEEFFKFANSAQIVMGNKFDGFLGNSLSLTVGLKAEIQDAISLSLTAAANIQIAALKLVSNGPKVEQAAANAETTGPKFKLGPLHFEVEGLKIIS